MPVPPQEVAAVLDEAADVVRKGWSQWHVALDAHGAALPSANDPTAVAVCSLGAIDVAASRRGAGLDLRVAALRVFGLYVTNGSSVAKWNADHGANAEYVAQKLHAAGREFVRGGPAHVAATPPLVAVPGDVPPEVAPRKKGRTYTPESKLRIERGALLSTLARQRRGNAPERDIAATEGRIRSLEKRLVVEFGADEFPPIPAGIESSPAPPAADDPPARGVFERKPGTESGL